MEWKEGIGVADRRSAETVWSRYVATPASLLGQPLPDLASLGISSTREKLTSHNILLCLCDINQRPSRHSLGVLAKQVQELRDKGVFVLVLQAVESEEAALARQVKEQNLPWPVRTIKGDTKKVRLTWGVRSLPWLILTDSCHVVTAEGFPVVDFDDKLKGLENQK